MPLMRLTVELVPLVSHTEKRAVAFLRGHQDLDACTEYDAIKDTSLGKRLRHKMALWIGFKPDTKGKFHRFKNDEVEYRDCFVFIDLEESVRFYGFTCHPTPKTNSHFELVVLTTHAIKKRKHTDTAELNRVVAWKDYAGTKAAIKEIYPDIENSKKGPQQ